MNSFDRTATSDFPSIGGRRLPQGAEIMLDHVGHFVADLDAAGRALTLAGFAPTPFSAQVAPAGPGGALELTGTGNVCAMLQRGYVEVLGQTADAPLGRELAAAVGRWGGVHLAAFAVADAAAAHERLGGAGFATRPLVHMSRPVETVDGPAEARFTVARVMAEAMPEGRIQILTQQTEDAVWQPRWLDQPNGAEALLGILLVSADPAEAAARFARFLGRPAVEVAGGHHITLDRGHVHIRGAEAARPLVGAAPGLPWLAAYGVQVRDLGRIRAMLGAAGLPVRQSDGVLLVPFPAALGRGLWAFVETAEALPWLR
jgi:hypothetical protein